MYDYQWWDCFLACWSLIGEANLEHWATGKLPRKAPQLNWQFAERPNSHVAR